MDNPFQIINDRLTNIEDLLLSLKHEKVKPMPESKADNTGDEFLSKRMVAKMLNCSTSTVDNWRRGGKLKPYYLGMRGKAVRFKRAEVLALLEKE